MSELSGSKADVWQQISKDIDGDFIDCDFWGSDVLKYKHDDWEIILDTYTVTKSKMKLTYTRMRAPFVNNTNFDFKIYREGLFSSVGKIFGMQDIEIGDDFFDKEFIIKSNDAEKVKVFFNDEKLKELIHEQPEIMLEIKEDDGWFKQSHPEGVDELYFECVGIITETVRLKSLFEMFALTLDRLVHIDATEKK